MKTKIPEWADWLKMTEDERLKCHYTWNPYKGEGQDIVEKVLFRFREEYGNIAGLEILGKAIFHGGTWVISIQFPFIFDKRKVPKSFLGIDIRAIISDESLPEEFIIKIRKKCIWAPERYEKFVDNYMEKIRRELGDPGMDKLEILSALCGQDFNEYIKQYDDNSK